MRVSNLRPGLLVSLKTNLTGNVSYQTRDLENDRYADGEAVARWETIRTTVKPEEQEAGVKARGKARTAVLAVCSQSSFGLLCPADREGDLEEAVAEARRVADEFNAAAEVTHLHVGIIVGRIAEDDVEAVRSINAEIRSLLEDMERGIRKLSVKEIREAANKARGLGQMLSPEAASRVEEAIKTARSTARRIAKAGDVAAAEVDTQAVAAMRRARTAFLDLDEVERVEVDTAPDGRALDLEPEEEAAEVPEFLEPTREIETAPASEDEPNLFMFASDAPELEL